MNAKSLRMTKMNNDLMLVPRSDLELLVEPAGHKERISIRRHEAMFKWRALLAAPAAHADEDSERAKFEATRNPHTVRRNEVGDYVVAPTQDAWSGWLARAALAAPVQSEQEPVGWQFYSRFDDEWRNPMDDVAGHRERMEAAGYQTRDVYAAPVQSEQEPEAWAEAIAEGVQDADADRTRPLQDVKSKWAVRAAPVRAVMLNRPRKVPCGNSFIYDYSVVADAPVPAVRMPDADTLAEIIRRVDGNHSLGAGALAEKVIEEVSRLNGERP